jgi:hypothetical protein
MSRTCGVGGEGRAPGGGGRWAAALGNAHPLSGLGEQAGVLRSGSRLRWGEDHGLGIIARAPAGGSSSAARPRPQQTSSAAHPLAVGDEHNVAAVDKHLGHVDARLEDAARVVSAHGCGAPGIHLQEVLQPLQFCSAAAAPMQISDGSCAVATCMAALASQRLGHCEMPQVPLCAPVSKPAGGFPCSMGTTAGGLQAACCRALAPRTPHT